MLFRPNEGIVDFELETGWPSRGDENEVGAMTENAKKYNGNLIKLLVIIRREG